MVILATVLLTYIIRGVAPDAGYELSINRLGCRAFATLPLSMPPENISMSPNGSSIAFVEYPESPRCGEDRIVLVHNGLRMHFDRPEATTPSDDADDYAVSSLRVTDNGDVFATLSDRFSGAFMGIRKRSYLRGKTRWHELNLNLPRESPCDDNVTIAAAATIQQFAVNVDCDGDFLPSLQESQDSRYAAHAAIIFGKGLVDLGTGTVASMIDSKLAGYIDGLHHSSPPSAVLWLGTQQIRLGRGIGFGSRADGTVVGDDRPSWFKTGHPTIWYRRRKTELSKLRGSAFAIRGNTIVGSVSGRAFIAEWFEGLLAFRVVRDLRHSFHVVEAFAISKSGRILALGTDKRSRLEVLTLDPQK